MPRVIVEDKNVVVPPVIAGGDLLNVPEVKELAGGTRSAFIVDPETKRMEIVDPEKTYHVQDGTVIDAAAPSRSGVGVVGRDG